MRNGGRNVPGIYIRVLVPLKRDRPIVRDYRGSSSKCRYEYVRVIVNWEHPKLLCLSGWNRFVNTIGVKRRGIDLKGENVSRYALILERARYRFILNIFYPVFGVVQEFSVVYKFKFIDRR